MTQFIFRISLMRSILTKTWVIEGLVLFCMIEVEVAKKICVHILIEIIKEYHNNKTQDHLVSNFI